MNPKRLALVVAACAVVVHLGALRNGFSLDDIPIILLNPIVRGDAGAWRAFVEPYWPPDLGGKMYRPLPIVSYAADRLIGTMWWFHGVNVLWHAAAAVGLALFARRFAGDRAGLAAGLIFAVHPVHVEAIANVVGRAELMATAFAGLSVYAAITRRHPAWSAVAFAAGLLCKENAVVAPAIVAWAWIVGIDRPPRRTMAVQAAWWLGVAALYAAVRWQVLHPYARFDTIALTFVNQSPVAIRMTAIAALTDLVRLLVFPLHLRVEYSPNERTIVTSPFESSFLIGLVVIVWWVLLIVVARRRGRLVEAFGLGWIALAYLPVANILFPTGVVMAERTLYLPSAGFALALGALVARLETRRFAAVLALIVVAGGVRSALRVPIWRDDWSVTLSILRDSPLSYRGPARAGAMHQSARDPGRALIAYRNALKGFKDDPAIYVAAADAAFTLKQPALADSMLERANRLCFRCSGSLRVQATSALARGDSATADSLFARARLLEQP